MGLVFPSREVYLYENLVGPVVENLVRGLRERASIIQTYANLLGTEAPSLLLYLNSPGGGLFDGLALHDAIRGLPMMVTGQVDGRAGPAACIALQACEWRRATSSAILSPCIDTARPWDVPTTASPEAFPLPFGMESLMAVETASMEQVEDQGADSALSWLSRRTMALYRTSTGLSARKIAQLVDRKTWLPAKEALNWHLIDEVLP